MCNLNKNFKLIEEKAKNPFGIKPLLDRTFLEAEYLLKLYLVESD